MADEVRFWNANDADVHDAPFDSNGKIIITKRTEIVDGEEKHYANLYADLDGKRYILKPPYSWDELNGESTIVHNIDNRLEKLEKFAGHFWVIRKIEGDPAEEVLHIYSAQDEDTGEIEDEGTPVTRADLKDLITDGREEQPGSFLVDDKPVYISDFVPSEELVGYLELPIVESDENDEI